MSYTCPTRGGLMTPGPCLGTECPEAVLCAQPVTDDVREARTNAESSFVDLIHRANLRADRASFYSPLEDGFPTDDQYDLSRVQEYLRLTDNYIATLEAVVSKCQCQREVTSADKCPVTDDVREAAFLPLPRRNAYRSHSQLSESEMATVRPRCPYCGTTNEANAHTDSCPLGSLLTDRDALRAEVERLREVEAAAKAVCWFDWSSNDDDAVAAVDQLRAALSADEKVVKDEQE